MTVRVARARGRVLVLGSDERAFLSVVRSLGRRGVEVDVAWCEPGAVALRSRYVRAVREVPRYEAGSDAWLRGLEAVVAQGRYDLVIPCNDPSVIPLQAYRQEVERFGRFYLLPERAFEVAFDKLKTYELAEALGVPVPRQVRASDVEPLLAAAERFGFPVAVKPCASFSLDDLGRKQHVRMAADPGELARWLRAMLPRGEVAVQEHFTGRGLGIELLAHEGDVLFAFQHERVHEPLHGGGSSYRRSVPVTPHLLEAAAHMVRALDYTGVAMVELKVNPRTGAWALMEINGRFWGSLPLAIAAGADFPWLLYQMLVHGRRRFRQRYRCNIYGRNLVRDMEWHLDNLRADRNDPTLMTRPLLSVAAEARNLLTLSERFDTLVLDDPRPGIAALAGWARSFAERVRMKLTMRLSRSGPLRRARRRAAARALASARSVLFVCKGNICRSPYAEHYARKVLGDGIEVSSSGFYPKTGRPSPEIAVETAQRSGIDLTQHRSRVLDGSVVAHADVIFVFDEENLRTLRERYPAASGKAHLLATLDDALPLVIDDPYGSDSATFDRCYQAIRQGLDGAVGTSAAAGAIAAASRRSSLGSATEA